MAGAATSGRLFRAFAPRPILLVAADKDDIFPASHYGLDRRISNVQLIRNEEVITDSALAARGWREP